jgi:undecaprenyl diphosphate synthase
MPRHIAIIMDGNGRWAQSRTWARIRGHRAGVRSVREAAEECARLGIGQLTLYAFSSENWKRPPREVDLLMHLLRRFLVSERSTILEHNIRFRTIGRIEGLPAEVRHEIAETARLSADKSGTTLCLALNYGGRAEIADAARRIAEEARAGHLDPASVDETALADRLYQADMPEPDLLIRTAGELRISNFLLWQISYAEIHVTEVLWPDFRVTDLHKAIRDYAGRDRRFGGLGA